MKRCALVVAACLLIAGVANAQTAVNRTAVEKQVLSMERAINDAFVKGDLKAFHRDIAPDGIGVDGTGILKIADYDKMMADMKIQNYTIDMSQFYWVNDRTVVHMYRWSGKGTYQGQPVPSPTWASTVWTNRAGKWTAVFHQETTAMPPPPTKPAAK